MALEGKDDPDVRLRRALALERLGMGEEALIEFEGVRAADPADSVVRSHLADRYEAAGRLREAEAEHRFLAEREPPRASDWERLAGFYQRHGRLRDATAAHERARTLGARTERTLRPLLPSRN
jgi:Flp pilus assembly protein TadD